MATLSILEITGGVESVNLVTSLTEPGAHLKDWNPGISQFKGGGVRQSSSLASLSRLVEAQFENGQETFTLTINGQGQDETIFHIQELLRLLQEAIYYWVSEEGEPVYIKAKSPCETNTRYADIRNYSIPNVDNPYAAPFFVAGQLAAMDEIQLTIERGHWLANPPGVGECAEIGNQEDWVTPPLWATVSTAVTDVQPIIQLGDGSFRAGGRSGANNPRLYSSADGATWAIVADTTAITAGTGRFRSLLADSIRFYAGIDGSLVAGVARLFRTTNQTAPLVWGQVFSEAGGNAVYDIVRANDGAFLIITTLNVHRSPSGAAASWSIVRAGGGQKLFKAADGTLFAAGPYILDRSTDNGVTWTTVLYVALSGGPDAMTQDASGNIYAVHAEGGYISSDNGVTWEKLPAMPTSYTPFAMESVGNVVYLVGSGAGVPNDPIYFSIDQGANWIRDNTDNLGGSVSGRDALYGSDGYLYMTDAGNNAIYRTNIEANVVEMGSSGDCEGGTYLINQSTLVNLTHIKISDGGVFTDLFPMTVFPTNLLPAVPAANDALYFGIVTTDTVMRGQFSGLVLDLATVLLFTTSVGAVWEYWNGAWVTLTVKDNTILANQLGQPGVVSVHWERPADWATTSVNGVTAYWVRLRITSTSGTVISIPSQQSRQIYATGQPFIEMSGVVGDIPALAQLKIINRSDADGRGGNAPNLWFNRAIIGLQSFETSSNFQAFINLSDQQTVPGIAVSLAASSVSYTTDTTVPTGRRVTIVAGAGTEPVTINISPSLARDYYGTFRLYLRGRRTSGSASGCSLAIQINNGSGGISFTSEVRQFQTTTAFELLDFGQISLPISGALKSSDLTDTLEIKILITAVLAIDVYLYDLILIPVSEWAIDAIDGANNSDSIVGLPGSNQLMLDVDSVSDPLRDIKALVRQNNAQELVTGGYNPITNGEAILQNNLIQRLWFLFAQTSATGTSYSWIARPDIAASVQLLKNERYLALRGDR